MYIELDIFANPAPPHLTNLCHHPTVSLRTTSSCDVTEPTDRPTDQEETQGGTRVSLFSLFGLEKQKKRKRKLVGVLWCDHALADASAEVVLSVFRDHMEARHAWVENKRDARVRADLLCTVQVRPCLFVVRRVFCFVLFRACRVVP